MRVRISAQVLAIVGLVLVTISAIAKADEKSTLDLDQYRGKVVVIDFWASWCVPCRRSFPWMNAMQDRYGEEGLVFVAVNLDSAAEDAATFLDDYPADFEIVYDPNGDIAQAFGVIAMPSSYIYDREGKQVGRHLGFKVRQQDEYEAVLVETLNQ